MTTKAPKKKTSTTKKSPPVKKKPGKEINIEDLNKVTGGMLDEDGEDFAGGRRRRK